MTNGEKLQKILRRLGKREGRIEGLEKGLVEGRIEGRIEGKIQGRIEGEHAEALRIARTLLEDGMAMESVLRITGLTADDIVVSHH